MLWGFALSGFAALGYEVVWTRLLSIFSLNAVFSFTIMLTTFLVGLAIGGALMARRVDHVERPLVLFGTLELGIGVAAILMLFVFAKLPTMLARFDRDRHLWEVGLCRIRLRRLHDAGSHDIHGRDLSGRGAAL